MKHILTSFGTSVLLLILCAAPLCAQQQEQDQNQDQNQNQETNGPQPIKPDQPIESPDSKPPNEGGDANVIPAVVTPETQQAPLAGSRQPSFEAPPEHSYYMPRLDFVASVNTNGQYTTGSGAGQLASTESLLGGITLAKINTKQELKMSYLGGRSFSPDGDIYNSTIQLFGLSDRWTSSRWSGTVADQLRYASDPIFGTGIPGLDITGINFQPIFTPNQTVITARTPSLNNTAVGEVDYQSSLRGTFTFVGSYALLHFYGSGLINSDATNFQAGYNYLLTPRDTIAVLYRFGALRFSNNVQSINDNVVEFSYGHQIVERFSFRIAAGPSIAFIQQPNTPSQTYFSGSLSASLLYTLERTTLTAGYSHGLTTGGGVLLGSLTDQFSFTVLRQLSRNWSLNGLFGYSRNSPVTNQTVGTFPATTIDSIVGGGGVTRTIGRDMAFFASYQGYFQVSGQPICTGPTCGTNLKNNQFTAGFGWHPKPIPF
jgi:hypothetical protein